MVKALVLLVMALFLLACGLTPPTLKTGPVATRLVETIEAEGPTGHTVILYGKVIDAESRFATGHLMEKPGFSLFEQEDRCFWDLLRRERVFHQPKNLVSDPYSKVSGTEKAVRRFPLPK